MLATEVRVMRSRTWGWISRIVASSLLLLLGFGAGLVVTLFKLRSIGLRALGEQTRAVMVYDLEVLGSLRTGDQEAAVRLLEGSLFHAATLTYQAKGWSGLSAEDRRALQFTRAYGEKIGWNRAAEARDVLSGVSLEGFEASGCKDGLRRFLETPAPRPGPQR